MIIFDGRKFACDRCQRGHRNASCEHLGRALLEVRSVGRPVGSAAKGAGSPPRKVEGTILILEPSDPDVTSLRTRLSVPGACDLVVQRGKAKEARDDLVPATFVNVTPALSALGE
ncbi:hypothetical protein HK104_002276 [Borealophlyctis nickersoniae]|nr:hypothetical protein HK104_002276 [Borealophlyctis nickersoniae]